MFFNQIQIITPAVEPDWEQAPGLTIPLSPRAAFPSVGEYLLAWTPLLPQLGWFFRASPTLLNLRISFFRFLTQICMGSRSSVSPRLTKMDTCGFIRERGRGLVPLLYVEVRFEIIEDGVGVSPRLLFWQGVSRSLGLEFPFLDDSIARLLEPYRPFCCFKERLLFSRCLRCHVCHSENVWHIHTTGCRDIGILFACPGHNCQQALQKSTSRRSARIERDGAASTTPCLFAPASESMPANTCFCRKMIPHTLSAGRRPSRRWGNRNCSSFWAYFHMSLEITDFCETRFATHARITPCKLPDIFD